MSNFDAYERCPKHGCPVMRVTADAAPVCLLDWLAERYLNRQVVDVVPRSDAYGDLVLENSAVLPGPLRQRRTRRAHLQRQI